MNTLIERRHNRLVNIKIATLKQRTGGYFQIVDLHDSTKLPVELDTDILKKALITLFEAMVYDNHKRADAEKLIADHYANCIGVQKLTPHGVDFMNALIATLAEELVKKQGMNATDTTKPEVKWPLQ